MIEASHLAEYAGTPKFHPGLLAATMPWALTIDREDRSTGRMIPDENNGQVAPSDNDLLMRVASQQDREAFAQLFKSIAPRIKSYMMKLGASPDAAEEIAQETLITVWRKSVQFDRQKSSAITWIFTIARNLRIDRLRKENRPALDPNEPLLVPDNPRSPLAEIEESTVVNRVTAAIDDLPSDQQEAVRLSFIEGLSHGEISERLNVPLGTIKSRLRLSFEKLRLSLGDIR
jgi:RNA polymerase sigma-70 factor (ECF subfamily)